MGKQISHTITLPILSKCVIIFSHICAPVIRTIKTEFFRYWIVDVWHNYGSYHLTKRFSDIFVQQCVIIIRAVKCVKFVVRKDDLVPRCFSRNKCSWSLYTLLTHTIFQLKFLRQSFVLKIYTFHRSANYWCWYILVEFFHDIG